MRLRIAAVPVLGLILSAAAVFAQPGPLYDIVIRNGRLLDGNGNPWVEADVAIKVDEAMRAGAGRVLRGAGYEAVAGRGHP